MLLRSCYDRKIFSKGYFKIQSFVIKNQWRYLMYIFHDIKQKLVYILPKRYPFGNMDFIILSVKTLYFRKQIFRQKCETMKLPDSWKKSYIKCNCKQKHFLWFLPLSTPCMSVSIHTPLFLPQFPRISNLILCIATPIPQILSFFPEFPTSPQWFAAFPPLFSIFSTWFSALLAPIPPILLTPLPDYPFRHLQMAAENGILTSLKTLSTSWRNSHRSVCQENGSLE